MKTARDIFALIRAIIGYPVAILGAGLVWLGITIAGDKEFIPALRRRLEAAEDARRAKAARECLEAMAQDALRARTSS